MNWAYGLVTVPERRLNLLPKTLASLAKAGFDAPRLFIDGSYDDVAYRDLDLPYTVHYKRLREWGNWVLGLWELYLRNPAADYYAMFQDDLLACTNLKGYLEQMVWPSKGYLNLYTYPEILRQAHLQPGQRGWFATRQYGKGALALVFPHESIVDMLCCRNFVTHCEDTRLGWRNTDGIVVTAMKVTGWKEFCHNPSLVQHTGEYSTFCKRINNNDGFTPLPVHHWSPESYADTFPGEAFDALTLLGATSCAPLLPS